MYIILHSTGIVSISMKTLCIIFKSQYSSYEDALKLAKFTTLEIRREKLCLKFAKECTRNEKLKDMFPLSFNDHNMDKRHLHKFKVNHAKTERYKLSSIPYLQRLLNSNTQFKYKCINLYSMISSIFNCDKVQTFHSSVTYLLCQYFYT